MAYFSKFPKTKFLNQTIVNLATGIKLSTLIKEDVFALTKYEVEPGERPEHIAHNYYGDVGYSWLVLLANKIIDPYFEWPLSVNDFNSFIKKKYGSIAAAQATNIHCEHKTKNITVSADSLVVSNGASSSDYNTIDAYTYWDRINDNRRQIELINVVYLPLVDAEFNKLV